LSLHQIQIGEQATVHHLPFARDTRTTLTVCERDTTEAYCPCDAYAEQASQPGLAVEHTIIPTFDVQKEKDAQFMRAIGDLVAVDYLCGTVGS